MSIDIAASPTVGKWGFSSVNRSTPCFRQDGAEHDSFEDCEQARLKFLLTFMHGNESVQNDVSKKPRTGKTAVSFDKNTQTMLNLMHVAERATLDMVEHSKSIPIESMNHEQLHEELTKKLEKEQKMNRYYQQLVDKITPLLTDALVNREDVVKSLEKTKRARQERRNKLEKMRQEREGPPPGALRYNNYLRRMKQATDVQKEVLEVREELRQCQEAKKKCEDDLQEDDKRVERVEDLRKASDRQIKILWYALYSALTVWVVYLNAPAFYKEAYSKMGEMMASDTDLLQLSDGLEMQPENEDNLASDFQTKTRVSL